MAYSNFKPTIWSKYIQTELERDCILVSSCNTQFQGEVGEGKRVKIIGAALPSVGTYTPGTNINAAETPADTSVYLDINQYKYVHFIVDDVDEAQSVEGLMQTYMKGAKEQLARTRDTYVAGLAASAPYASASTSTNTADEALAAVDAALVNLRKNDVPIGANVVIEVTPWFYSNFRSKLIALGTDNMDLIRQGVVGVYDGALVKMSNSLYNDTTDDYLMVRTKDAIAFAGGISKVEAYRPDLQFGDAIKMLDTFGAKIVRPKELYVIKAHNS